MEFAYANPALAGHAHAPAASAHKSGHFSVRRRILFVGKRLFATFGYAGTTLDEIARAADVEKEELLEHFGDRAALLIAILDEEWQTINPRMDDILLTSVNAKEAVLATFAAMARILDKDRDLAHLLLFGDCWQRGVDGKVHMTEGCRGFTEHMVRLAQRGQQDATFTKALHPRVIASLLTAGMQGLIRDWLLSDQERGISAYSGSQLITAFDALVVGMKP